MRVVCTLMLLAACSAAQAQEPNARELLAAVEKQLKDTAATAGPSIATIVVSRSEHYPKPTGEMPGKLGGFDPKEFLKNDATLERANLAHSLNLSDMRTIPDHGYAGGVVIDAEGYILTPYHVIDGATKVYVFLPGGSGSYADIHAADARSDLAVLKLIAPPPRMQAIKFAEVRTTIVGDKKPTVFQGKLCVLMTNPYSPTFHLDRPSAGFGSITSVRHKPTPKGPANRATEYGTLLEYDIKPNSGMTGGVLLNLDGEMIGLTNAAAVAWGNEIGAGYAMPADDNFRRIVQVLRKGEEVEFGFLGVSMVTLTQNGTTVEEVTPLGPAAKAGIESGDQITKINDVPIDTFHDLLFQAGSALAGTKVKVTVSRAGRSRDFDVVLAKFKHENPSIVSVQPEPVFGLRVDYTSTRAQELKRVVTGVTVREAVANSPAAAKFKTLDDGDPKRWIITDVDGTPVANPAEFYKAAKGQAKVKLTLTDPTAMPPRTRELTLP